MLRATASLFEYSTSSSVVDMSSNKENDGDSDTRLGNTRKWSSDTRLGDTPEHYPAKLLPINKPTANYGTMIQALRVPQTQVDVDEWAFLKRATHRQDTFDLVDDVGDDSCDLGEVSWSLDEEYDGDCFDLQSGEQLCDSPQQSHYIYPGNPYEGHSYDTPSYIPKMVESTVKDPTEWTKEELSDRESTNRQSANQELIRKYDDPAPWIVRHTDSGCVSRPTGAPYVSSPLSSDIRDEEE